MPTHDRLGAGASKLLKLARTKADEINVAMVALRVSRNSTETALARLDHDFLEEQKRAELEKINQGERFNPANMQDFNAYTDKIRVNRTNMLATIGQLNERENVLKSELADCFTEIKKLEHLIEVAERSQRRMSAKKASKQADQVLMARYGRG